MSTDLVGSVARAAIGLAALMFVSLAAPMAHGQSPDGGPQAVLIDELKSVYLSCSSAAADGRLDTAAIMQCSIVYEELKRRAFGGDFGRLLAWSRAQPPMQSAGR
jgi:hypothetical protein